MLLILPSNEDFRDVCGVKCMGRAPLPLRLTPAEDAFRDAVSQEVVGNVHVCARVDKLHRQVQSGTVRMAVAASLASELYVSTDRHVEDAMLCLLRGVLLHKCMGRKVTCACLHKILSWGTCVHVIAAQWAYSSRHELVNLLDVMTPMGSNLLSQRLADIDDMPILWARGSPPWHMYRCQVTPDGLRKLGTEVKPYAWWLTQPPVKVTRQFWRWHARPCRRLWVWMGVVCMGSLNNKVTTRRALALSSCLTAF